MITLCGNGAFAAVNELRVDAEYTLILDADTLKPTVGGEPCNKSASKDFVKKITEMVTENIKEDIVDINELKNAEKAAKTIAKTIVDEGVKQGCIAPAGSRFTVLEKGTNDVTIYFKRLSSVSDGQESRAATLKKSYTISTTQLKLIAKEAKSITYDIKAIIIPQKMYANYTHTSEATIGVAYSIYKQYGNSELGVSWEVGTGFNQHSVQNSTSGDDDQVMGLSIFAGAAITGVTAIELGIYLGVDLLKLDDDQRFDGESKEAQAWLGLAVSTSF